VTDDLQLGDLLGDDVDALASTLTPNLGLPYPASSDPVAAGATNIRDLALALDANSKLVSVNTPVLAASTLRAGAYVGEVVLIWLQGGIWHTNENLLVYARWGNPDGAANKWHILGPPVMMDTYVAAAFTTPAGTNNDIDVFLDCPAWVTGWLVANVQLNSGLVDVILTDSASHSVYWSSSGRLFSFANVRSPFYALLQGRCYLQYYSPSAPSTVANRRLGIEIAALTANA
jgi:hypothetical protein